MLDFDHARRRMVEAQVAGRGIRDPRILEAFAAVPREGFVAPGDEPHAYDDTPLPIGEGQTISQPYVVALMIEAAGLRPEDRVLEVGAGSGYAAAVLSLIAARVHAVERRPALADAARDRLRRLGYGVELKTGDGTLGLPEAAPFDAILVSAGGPAVPAALRAQLALGGRLVMPVGTETDPQELVKVTRQGPEVFAEERLGRVRFVPLIGAEGWAEAGRPA